jgi:hypothetical protein
MTGKTVPKKIDTLQYRTMEKSAWGDGPWQDEPDKVQWSDETTGYACLIVRNWSGALCGYVGVQKGHPLYERSWSDCQDFVKVHGGLTYSNHCQESQDGSRVEESGICHKTHGDDKTWWLGFDTCHAWDVVPGYPSEPLLGDWGTWVYRDIAYVRGEVASLARQLKEMEKEECRDR